MSNPFLILQIPSFKIQYLCVVFQCDVNVCVQVAKVYLRSEINIFGSGKRKNNLNTLYFIGFFPFIKKNCNARTKRVYETYFWLKMCKNYTFDYATFVSLATVRSKNIANFQPNM